MSYLRVIPEVIIVIKNGVFTEFLKILERFVSLENIERKSRIHIYIYSHCLVKTIYVYVSKVRRKIHSKVKKSFECFRCFFFTNFLNFPSGKLSFADISL